MSKSCDDVSSAAFIANWDDLAFHKNKWALWRGEYRIDLKNFEANVLYVCSSWSGHGEPKDIDGHDVEGGC